MGKETKASFTPGEVCKGVENRLVSRGFGEKALRDIGDGAENIFASSDMNRVEAIAFSQGGEKEYRPFLDEILPQLSFNQIGWYLVALRLICAYIRENSKSESIAQAVSRESKAPEEEPVEDAQPENEPEENILPRPERAEAEALLKKYRGNGDIQKKNACLQEILMQTGFGNTNEAAVLEKVRGVMKLYGKISPRAELTARQIVNQNLDELLANGYEEAVQLIVNALGQEKSSHGNYYFAVRYCLMHNPEKFPVIDDFAVKAMKYYRDKYEFFNFADDEPFVYAKYKKLLGIFRSRFELSGFSLADISRILTAAGRSLDK